MGLFYGVASTGWMGVVFEDNPEVFESQVGPNPNRQKSQGKSL